MGPCGPTRGNILLIRQNDFSLTYIQLLYYLTRKAIKSSCLIYNICVFLQKETSRCRAPIFLVSRVTQKNSRKLKLHAFLHFDARKHMVSSFGLKWTESTKKFAFVPLVCPQGSELSWKKVQNFLRVWSTSSEIMISFSFQHENGVIHGILTFWDFSSKIGLQKHTHFMQMKVNCLINFLNLHLPLCINIYFRNL